MGAPNEAPKKKQPNWSLWLWVGVGSMVVSFIFVPAMLSKWSWGWNYTSSGQIGDTIGGIMGPIVAGIGGLLTFLAFREQYKSNEKQRESIEAQLAFNKKQEKAFGEQKEAADAQVTLLESQTKATQISTIESRLFSLLETHSSNVKDIFLNGELPSANSIRLNPRNFPCNRSSQIHTPVDSFNVRGRACFPAFFEELTFLLDLSKRYSNSKEWPSESYGNVSEEDAFQVAYLIFYFGATVEGQQLSSSLVEGKKLNFLQNMCGQIRTIHKEIVEGTALSKPEGTILGYEKDFQYPFLPGLGQMTQLSHYYRHLFHMVDFIDTQSSNLIDDRKKYQYISSIRSQLSIHEQLMLYCNALSVLGSHWLHKKTMLMETYCLVRGIPLPMANEIRDPKTVLRSENPLGHKMFEWLEIQERLNRNEITTPPQG